MAEPSKGTLSRTVSEIENGTAISGRKSMSLGRKIQSPRVSGHIPKWRSGQFRVEDQPTNAFFEEAALSRASSASLGLSFSIAGPVVTPDHSDFALINDLQEARVHASMALSEKERDNSSIEVAVKIKGEEPARDPTLPIFLKFSDVKYKIILKSKTSIFLRNSCHEESISFEKEILHGVTGSVVPGEVLAMMGPSGSGKTTLINLLAGRIRHNISGSITYNDLPFTKALKRRIGFVMQDDVLFPHLTVKETLTYAALLRLPNTMTRQQKKKRVHAVIYELGLERCQDTIIGGAFLRGVSGGERKRVCIGHEILIDPSLLFLDEPTSGLDSTTALRIVQMLRDMAEAGRTIVTTIHQPSSRLFHKFDKLILLGEGHSIYFGKASNAMDYFASVGCTPLLTMNPADFLLDIANGNIHDISVPPELEAKVRLETAQAETKGGSIPSGRPSAREVQEYLVEAYEKHIAPKEKKKLLELNEIKDDWKSAICSGHEWGATWWQQYSILFRRGLKERRHEYLSCLRVAQVLSTAVILGMLWWQSKIDTPKALQDQGLGLAIGAAFMDLKKATTLASVTMLTFMLAGGFFVQRVPAFIKWIKYLSFNYYTYRLLVKIQYDADQQYDCSSAGGCKSIATSPALRNISLDGGMKEAGIMFVMIFGYRFLAYLSLKRMKLKV